MFVVQQCTPPRLELIANRESLCMTEIQFCRLMVRICWQCPFEILGEVSGVNEYQMIDASSEPAFLTKPLFNTGKA